MSYDKEFITELRRATAEHLDNVIYPKIKMLVEAQYKGFIQNIAREAAVEHYTEKNREVVDALTKIISLLVKDKAGNE